jgi:hypothetical protein
VGAWLWVGRQEGDGRWKEGRRGETYAPDHILVSMNKGMLCSADSGLDGPKTLVKCNATSSDTYSVAMKNAGVRNRMAIRKLSSISLERVAMITITTMSGSPLYC